MPRVEYFFCALVFTTLPAAADPRPTDNTAAESATHVAALLALQRAGIQASPHPQTLPGDAQSRVWQRYLDSFAHPIPANYIEHGFKEK